MENHQPKISLPEAIFVGLLLGLADAIELLLLLVGLDDFWISDAIAFPATQIYLRMKGVRGTHCLIANLLELVPYLGSLPLRLIGFAITCWVDRHPKALKGIAAAAKGAAVVKRPAIPSSSAPEAAAPEIAPTPISAAQTAAPSPTTPTIQPTTNN